MISPPHPRPAVQPERINLNDKSTTNAWTLTLGVSLEQLRWAIAAVGDTATNVAKHLRDNRGTLRPFEPVSAWGALAGGQTRLMSSGIATKMP
jgi:hypothetical protein